MTLSFLADENISPVCPNIVGRLTIILLSKSTRRASLAHEPRWNAAESPSR